MAADPPKEALRVISAYLDDVDLDLDAAKRLIADPPNRFAAFHLQQAAEKLVKAIWLGHGLRVGIHRQWVNARAGPAAMRCLSGSRLSQD